MKRPKMEERKMRFMKATSISLALVIVLTASVTSIGRNGKSNASAETSIVGYISDSHCGLHHMKGMGDDKACTLMCVKGGSKFVLADRDHKRVYQLDKAGQEKAREFAGQKVKVTGTLRGRTIRVTGIEAAS
ncbi:MAG TPA: DUF5818 domain-containing protein [Pyrinomonadaceae bacterium]|nr:DUF5818 domain-containing protein [Pyrinomonadaceae bacterium]